MNLNRAQNTGPGALPFGGHARIIRSLDLSPTEDIFARAVNVFTRRAGPASGWTPINRPRRDRVLLGLRDSSGIGRLDLGIDVLAVNENVLRVLEKTFVFRGRGNGESVDKVLVDMETVDMEPAKEDRAGDEVIGDDVGGDEEMEDEGMVDEVMEDEEHDLYTLLGLGFVVENDENDEADDNR